MTSAVPQFTNLGNTEEIMRLAVEASPNGIVMTDRNGSIIMVNVATEKLFGYTRQELIGYPVEKLIPQRFHHNHPDHRQAYIGAHESRPMGHGRDLYGRHKNGTEFPIEVGLNPVETKHDGIFVLAAIVDITERQHAKELLSLAVEASPSGKIMTDQQGKILLVNSTTEELFGYKRKELLGQSVEMLIPVSHRAHHPELRNNYTKNPSRRAMGHGRDLHGLHKSGKEFPVEVGLNSIQTPNGIVVLASVIDISERKQQEEQLKSALKEKELLLAEIHHRVKNNLQIIDSLLSMQSDNLPDSITVDALQECQNRVKSMALIHQILYESRDFSRVNFSSFTQTLIDNMLISYMSDTSKVAITIQADSIHLPIDTSIPLGLILNELCTNALKYAFPGNRDGKIAITMKLQTSGHVLVQVSDTGIGIPDDLDIENTSSLGLQLVQLLSEQIAAELTIQRKNPTSFTLLIPVSK